jgi:uncharacterized protein
VAITLHSTSVPTFVRLLKNLSRWLDKAQAHAEARKFDPNVLLGVRLAPDMLPFVRQVQIACDAAKFGVARPTGVEAPRHEDNETSLDQLRERIAKTIAFVESVSPEQFAGCETREVTVPNRAGSFTMTGEDYVRFFALPNFLFHVTTAYGLLRHNGVELGKSDFLPVRG